MRGAQPDVGLRPISFESVVDGQELVGRAVGLGPSVTTLPFVIQLLVAVALAADGAKEGFHGGMVDIEMASAWRNGSADEECL